MSATEQAWTSWRKSSYSSNTGGNCIEVAWRKSSYSGQAAGNNCVEVALAADAVAVRDSKNTSGATLTFDIANWAKFVAR